MDDNKKIATILRVNHAGELGARQIYKAQRQILGDDPDIVFMANQEAQHLKTFTELMIEHRISPTVFQPLWHLLSYSMGAVTALMGKRASHACTIAVEEVIVEHYQQQIDELQTMPNQQALLTTIQQFQVEEEHHRTIAEQREGKQFYGYNALSSILKTITKTAIYISKKI